MAVMSVPGSLRSLGSNEFEASLDCVSTFFQKSQEKVGEMAQQVKTLVQD